jgi:hypothetical protein
MYKSSNVAEVKYSVSPAFSVIQALKVFIFKKIKKKIFSQIKRNANYCICL